jgi:3-hydroxyisobutyrate dehydrogenase-like beta-hydroxyacid dehydrogenase
MSLSTGIIGYGRLGSAIASDLSSYMPVFVSDKHEPTFSETMDAPSIRALSNKDLIQQCDLVFLCVPKESVDELVPLFGMVKEKKIICNMVTDLGYDEFCSKFHSANEPHTFADTKLLGQYIGIKQGLKPTVLCRAEPETLSQLEPIISRFAYFIANPKDDFSGFNHDLTLKTVSLIQEFYEKWKDSLSYDALMSSIKCIVAGTVCEFTHTTDNPYLINMIKITGRKKNGE